MREISVHIFFLITPGSVDVITTLNHVISYKAGVSSHVDRPNSDKGSNNSLQGALSGVVSNVWSKYTINIWPANPLVKEITQCFGSACQKSGGKIILYP